jgi:peptide/nickel transport system substrate-binding protein
MARRARFGVVAFVVAVGVLAAGGTVHASTRAAAQPQRGGTLTTRESNDNHSSWDPIQLLGIPSYDSPGSFAVFDTLFYDNPVTGQPVYRLATSMTSADGGTTWTLKLRPNVKFSDGTPFDAAAVQFNWQRAADPANRATPKVLAVAQPIQATQVVDPLTLKVTLKAADPNWNHRVGYVLATIGSPTAIKADPVGFGRHPVGAGPFLWKEWIPGDHMTFVRNPDYWEKGRPYVDQIVHRFIADETTKYNTFKTTPGSIDFSFSPDIIPQAKQEGYKVLTQTPNAGGWSIAFNNTKAPFTDPRVRQAISLAIDPAQFNTLRRGGDKALLITTIDKPGTPYYDKNLAMPKTNLQAAQKLVDQVVAETGKPIEFTLNVFNTPYIVTDAQVVQAQIAKLKNVNMTLNVVASTVIIASYATGNFQAFTSSNARWSDPAVDLPALFTTGSPSNYWRYSNPTVDSELAQLASATDQKTRSQLVSKIETQLIKDAPVAWYTRYASYTIPDKTIQNLTAYYDQRFLLDQVWLSTKK